MGKSIGNIVIKIGLSLLAALLLEGFLAVGQIRHGKGADGIGLWPDRLEESSGYEVTELEEGLLLKKTGEDPQLYFAPGGVPYGSICLEFGEPLKEDMLLQIYSTRGGEVYTENRYLLEGSQRAEFSIACRDYGRLRLDLDGSVLLQKAEAYPARSWSSAFLAAVRGGGPWSSGRELWTVIFRFFLWAVLAFGCISVIFSRLSREKRQKPSQPAGRLVYLDLLRSLAACFAVAYHVLCVAMLETPVHSAKWLVFAAGALVFLTCNPLFLIISGALLTGDKKERPMAFWEKRVVKTAIPLVLFYFLYMAVFWTGDLPWLRLAVKIGRTVLGGASDIAPHFWLMYALLGIYILVPFLRKTAGRLGEKGGLTLFGFIALLLTAATVLKARGLGGAQWFNWILWMGIFLSGYLVTRPWMRRRDGWIFALGIVTAAVSFYVMMTRRDYEGIIFNGSILICGISWAVTAAAIRAERFIKFLAPVLSFVGKHSFSVLLVHWLVLYGILLPGYIPGLLSYGTAVRLVGTFGFTMAISLGAAMVFDDLIFPGLQRIFSRTPS